MAILTFHSVALLLSFAPFSQANTHVHSSLRHRRQSVPTHLPGNWTSLGCFTDLVNGRTLTGPTFTSSTNMTAENCINFCDSQEFVFAGTEFGQECYCGNALQNGGTNTTASQCNVACTGNRNELCGAGGRLNIFSSGKMPPPPPQTIARVGNWVSLGCFTDGVNGAGRTLMHEMNLASNTIEACTTACFNAGFQFSGTEFADECYCDTKINTGGVQSTLTDCNMVCSGNSSEFCGGPNRLNLYNYTGTDLPPVSAGGGGGGNNGAPVFPVTSGLPGTWAYAGCFVDNANGRIIENGLAGDPKLTVESCIATCDSQNFSLAGMEFADECYCGDRLVNGATNASATDCNMACAGNSTEACGGPNRVSVYSTTKNITSLPIPVVQNTSLPGNWSYAGCFTDVAGGVRVLPWQIIWEGNNTAEACMNQCAAFGYSASGVEFGQECYCGDIEDLTTNGATLRPDSECDIECPGDPIHICGGGQRLTTYTWKGALNVWHTPQNIGRYEFFVPGLVAPLLATLGVNNKVAFLEKHGTSVFPNSTGAYELDLSLVGDFSKEWREMHTKTDVFCSGSIILPDRAGRQINVGGWSLDSTFGVRLYTPDGSAGVNGTNDWEEDGDLLKLQRMRWYPTAAILANGSILVIGGEIGSNDKPQANMEILPKPDGGDTVIDLDWLQRTDPNNLYPFVTVLPSGNVFIAYYNEARILNPVTFDTITSLPNMPGNVNNFLAGRTYPLEGAMVLFPQHAPYTDPLRVLICGGSTPGPASVSDNCVSISPEAPNATWTIERMPSRRVMACMVPLPDGTFMIMNGAQEGVAGFGLANDPNLNALLYDPTLPVGQRISILNNTIVPRMYHSEAILLPDGSVLISGSDPQTPGFDEETRIERYIPPYLNKGIRQPTFNISNHDWTYGQRVTISNVKVFSGSISGVRVSLVGAVSSTHGNSMGARTIFPQFSCSGSSCTVTAPPNTNVSPPGWHQLFILDASGTPSHSSWVRIGGDPSQLGNWPDLPGFTQPGVGPVTIPL
ncbi:hypothetical protein D9758_010585 [Tetrapyrgos nigripes]|uniref:WSC domain-containing protein n=1 Tax=Tetrapyrgos nigripes TaxID=182062 RepID=A0A8H5D512_9AGAR|nr:hypothetical protein D9758_010585 [Tetrapyrgos nigripes]